jgi:RNA-directed DNA polymerase
MRDMPRSETISTKQRRIAELAKQMPGTAMTSLSHHMDVDWLREAHHRTRSDGATGVDGQSAKDFSAELEGNLQALLDGAKSGTYRAPPVRRVYIPKGDGSKTRPLGIPTYADKVLQRAVAMLLEPLYEQDFYDFSYGFRPKRSAREAVESLDRRLWEMGGGWVLDVDIRGFFDNLDHGKLRAMLRQRVTDGVVVRLIGKWLRAGVLEGGVVSHAATGTPQGGVISPLLANIYLHEVVDKWWAEDVQPRLRGRAFLIRYADDFVMVFSSREDALRVQSVLPQRLGRFDLELHPEKTRLVDFRRPHADGGGPRPGSFDFLGFTFYWGRTRQDRWIPKQKTAKGRFRRGVRALNEWLRSARHLPVPEQARQLSSKLRGHYQYYGIRGNSIALGRFYHLAVRQWQKWLSRRSQRGRIPWSAFRALLLRHPLPLPRLPAGWQQRRFAFAKP